MSKASFKYIQSYFSELNPGYKLLLTLLFSVTFVFFGILIGSIFALPFWSFDEIIRALTAQHIENENIQILKYYQIIQSVSMFIIPPLFIGVLENNSFIRFLNFKTRINPLSLFFIFILMFAIIPVINFLGAINSEMIFPSWLSTLEQYFIDMENQATLITDKYLAMKNAGQLLFNIFMIGIIPALGEEFIFRGVVQKYFTQWTQSPHLSIWITAFIFSAFHLQFFGFIPRLVLGATFGYLYYFSKNIWLPVLAHFLNNTIAIVAYFFFNQQSIQPIPDQIGLEFNTVSILVNILLIFGIMLFIYKLEQETIKN